MAFPRAFIAIERTMSATMRVEWDRTARAFLKKLHPLLADEKWHEAHDAVNKLTMHGVVSKVKPKIEELAVASVLFGAHHVAGSVKATTFFKTKAIPQSLHNGVSQLVIGVEQNGAEFLRKQLHAVITVLQRKDEKAHVQKDEVSDAQLAEDGGLQEPEQAGADRKKVGKKCKVRKEEKTLYVNRPLVNADELRAWARTQGFAIAQAGGDMHATIAYSKEPVEWDNLSPKTDTVKCHSDARALAQFGDATVLRLESPDLEARWKEFIDAGASWSHDGFAPHITITWEGAPRPIAEIEPYRGPLIFGPEEFKTIDDNWSDGHEEEVLKADSALVEKLNDAVLRGGQVAIDVGANLTTSRLVSFGFLAEATSAGLETYQVNEILDGKTCPVCRYMHGKTFRVDNEYSRTLQALSTGDPNELNSITPWPDQSRSGIADLYDMTPEEMQGEGYGSPPYHPGCRGMLMIVGSVDETIPLGGGDNGGAELLPDVVGMFGGEVEAVVWDADRIAVLQDAVDAMTDPDLKDSAQTSMGAEDYETALSIAQDEAASEDKAVTQEAPKDWTGEAIEALKWGRFEVTDPDVFKLIDDAFTAEDFEQAEKLLTAWRKDDEATPREAGKATKEDPQNDPSPNAGKKKRKKQTASGREQDYTDIKPDSSQAGFDVAVENMNGAPIDHT